jgi:DNA-binding protein
MVGTNPLPNYVVGSYLKENYNKFVFIYSEKNENINQSSTADYADKLKEHLNLDNNYTLLPLNNVSSPSAIRDDLGIILEKFPKNNIDEVHLNYTGGTKTMAVHVYNFLKENFNDKFNASYLDARSHKLIYDNGEKESVKLKDKIKIDIDTLLSIHLYKKNKLETNDTYTYKQKFGDNFDSISEKIKNAIKDGKGKDFVKWLEDPFRKIFKGNNKLLEQTEKFKEHIQKLSGSNLSPIDKFNESPQFIWDILNAFPEDKRVNDGEKLWIPGNDINNNKQFSNRIKDTVEFLDGKWLEWYVYNEIRNELLNKGLEEGKHFGISLKAKKENSPESPDFELDIFIINGYQLVGISITTSDKQGDCKLKGFEVIHRVRQIGGDESKAILITGLSKDDSDKGPKKLQEDLSFITGTADNKIVVFGVDDWADIGDKIYREVFQ